MMKKKLYIFILMLLPALSFAQNEVYKRYSPQQDLTVAQVSGFALNDSVRVDVVLVVADDNAAWERVKKELDIRGDSGSTSWLGEFTDPAKRTGWNGRTVLRVVASHARRTVAFYRIDSERQYDALLDYQLRKMKKQ